MTTRHKTSTCDLRAVYDRFIYALKEVSRCYGQLDSRSQAEIDKITVDTYHYLQVQTGRMQMIKESAKNN
jgi:hypothetical protein